MFEMEKKTFLYLILLQMMCMSTICADLGSEEITEQYSGKIYYRSSHRTDKTWTIKVPDKYYVRFNVTELSTVQNHCSYGHVTFRVAAEGKEIKFCPEDANIKPIIASKDVNIKYSTFFGYTTTFRAFYKIETLVCAQLNHFRCSNHYCIHQHQVCDGVQDCENGADEKGCENAICAVKNHFRCSLYSCIHQHQVCDGVQDCENGADEKGCENGICALKNHFRCSLYFCIYQHQVCDGVQDCKNGADEKGCDNVICALKDHFRCSLYSCIHQHQVCDGVQDCKNGADEEGCENAICAEKNHFRCSLYSCIHQHQVCNGVQDCENGADEKGCETGESISRKNSIIWLKDQRSESFGWGKNTHRAITALYLAGAVYFRGDNKEEELMAAKLERQTLVALLRNSTNLSVSDLSMFINALTVVCYDTRQFYGYNLLQMLQERVTASKASSSEAYLTLCNANWKISQAHVLSLLRILQKQYEYPFYLDIQAMTVMALSCVKKKSNFFETIQNATKLYVSTAEKFIDGQLQDGSFGNIYTTALVTQALLSSGQENNKLWKRNSTVEFLMKELNTTADILSTTMILPIFSGTTLLDITNVHCRNRTRHGNDEDISDVKNKLGGKVRIQYSLYVGDEKDVIHTMHMRVPENSSAYDVMRLTQMVDNKYKFQHRDVSGQMYVYAIAGIWNDPEAGKFWLLYTGDSHINGNVHYQNTSPDKLILGDGEHLILWYRTADI